MEVEGERRQHKKHKKGVWTKEEDNKVKELVVQISGGERVRWSLVAQELPGE